jgi:hypothetical protein
MVVRIAAADVFFPVYLSLRRSSCRHAEHVFVAGISSLGSTRGRAMANDKLTTYKAKRDFRQTREPSGQDPVKPTTRRRFVIQKHDAKDAIQFEPQIIVQARSNPGL